ADLTDGIRGQPNRRLRIGSDFIPVPSGAVEPSFVEEGRREGVVPDSRVRFVDLAVMKEVVSASGAVQEVGRLGHPVDSKCDAIYVAEIGIDTAVVLILRVVASTGGYIVGNVSRGAKVVLAAQAVPIFRPWPGIVTQLTPSVRPALAQVEGLMPLLLTPEPGKVRYVEAMLPAGAK